MTTPELTRKEQLQLLKNNMDIVKRNIQVRLKELKWSQKDLAFYINSEPSYISYFMRRGGNCSLDFLGRLASSLNTTISDLTRI